MYKFFKRFMDIVLSLFLLVPVLFVIIVAFVWIKIDDGGPIFYMADRIGKKGTIFKMYKLRSMKVNAPDIRLEDGSTYNSESDPRVTRFGRIARKTSIDEIPQIFNILKGDMSFIGPRPDSASYLSKYTEEERVILTVRPGVTGYNQAINRNAVGTKEKLRNDIYYVEHISLWFDIKIIFMTVKSVLFHKNVYRSEKSADAVVAESNSENVSEKTNV